MDDTKHVRGSKRHLWPVADVAHVKWTPKPHHFAGRCDHWHWYNAAQGDNSPRAEYTTTDLPWSVPSIPAFGPSLIGGIDGGVSVEVLSHLRSLWEKEGIPTLQSGINAYELIPDLVHIGHMVKTMRAQFEYMRNHGHMPGASKKHPYGQVEWKSVNTYLDTAASSWLWYNYAAKPLMHDLKNIVYALLDFRWKVRTLVAGAGFDKVHVWHGAFKTFTEGGVQVLSDVSCPFWGNCQPCKYAGAVLAPTSIPASHEAVWLEKQPSVRKYGLTVYYSYKLEPWFDGLEGVTRAALAGVGLWPSLDKLWDLVPFSFIGDWFLPIGDILRKVKVPEGIETRIIASTWSEKITHSGKLQVKRLCIPGVCTAADYTYQSYSRYVDPIWLEAYTGFTWPTWLQSSLGAALTQKLAVSPWIKRHGL